MRGCGGGDAITVISPTTSFGDIINFCNTFGDIINFCNKDTIIFTFAPVWAICIFYIDAMCCLTKCDRFPAVASFIIYYVVGEVNMGGITYVL